MPPAKLRRVKGSGIAVDLSKSRCKKGHRMRGMLSFERLKSAVAAGEIDTVVSISRWGSELVPP